MYIIYAYIDYRLKKMSKILSPNFIYVPYKHAKCTRGYSQRRIMATVTGFCIQMYYFWKQNFSSLLMESIVL